MIKEFKGELVYNQEVHSQHSTMPIEILLTLNYTG